MRAVPSARRSCGPASRHWSEQPVWGCEDAGCAPGTAGRFPPPAPLKKPLKTLNFQRLKGFLFSLNYSDFRCQKRKKVQKGVFRCVTQCVTLTCLQGLMLPGFPRAFSASSPVQCLNMFFLCNRRFQMDELIYPITFTQQAHNRFLIGTSNPQRFRINRFLFHFIQKTFHIYCDFLVKNLSGFSSNQLSKSENIIFMFFNIFSVNRLTICLSFCQIKPRFCFERNKTNLFKYRNSI